MGKKESKQECGIKQSPREGDTGSVLQVSSKYGWHMLLGKSGITPGSKVTGFIYCLLVEGCPQALEVLPVLREGSC